MKLIKFIGREIIIFFLVFSCADLIWGSLLFNIKKKNPDQRSEMIILQNKFILKLLVKKNLVQEVHN